MLHLILQSWLLSFPRSNTHSILLWSSLFGLLFFKLFLSLKSFPSAVHLSLLFLCNLQSSLSSFFHLFSLSFFFVFGFLSVFQKSQKSFLFFLIKQGGSSFLFFLSFPVLLFPKITKNILERFNVASCIKFSFLPA